MNSEESDVTYTVVINEEEQYSIWPIFKEVPAGWKEVGKSGLKQDCLSYINEVWKDMRPLSLRKWMEEHQKDFEEERLKLIEEAKQNKSSKKTMSPTVEFLSKGRHPVTTYPNNKSVKDFKDALDRGYVHINFTDTQGGTCLGVKIDKNRSNSTTANFQTETGNLHIEGTLILDYVRIRCIADINLPHLTGDGHLEIIEEVTPAMLAKERGNSNI